ncbi:MAG: hypothetical protein J6A88_10900 [Oscillospiraceae bacterium]|nr:hypothetical protein [Oscillospiraceae bacterium]
MGKKKIPQEALKLIACVTMLLDHIGAVFVPWIGLRVIGRLAYPIYCFLLAEGAVRTRDPKKYVLRLAVGMILAEIPYDLLFYGGLTWEHQNVMVTLLLGFGMMMTIDKIRTVGLKFVLAVAFALAAEWLHTDYGGTGIFIIALFAVTRERKDRVLLQTLGQALVWWTAGGYEIVLGAVSVPIQIFAVLSMIPIAFYSGRKATTSRAVQTAFYLFYPVHLAILLILCNLIF